MKGNGYMSVTIKDIAVMCNVSTATVSRVINSPELVSVDTREKVNSVIKELNYVPNQIAKNFSSNVSNNIALFIFDIINPFYTKMIKELNRLAFDKNYSLIICDTENERERELRYIDYINSSKFAGLILTEGISGETITKIDNSCPLICIDRYVDCHQQYTRITTANREGARKALEYLVNLNHRKIAFVGGPEGVKTADERKKGYLDIVEKHQLPVDERYIYTGNFKINSGISALEYFLSLDEIPTAIFCANDLMAEGVLSRSQSLNINIPDDLSLVGFDGADQSFYRKLTTIEQSIEEIASTAINELFKLIENNNQLVNKKIRIPGQLIIGDTCKKYERKD